MADDAAAWLADLQKARASGVLSVRHGDTMTTFRSLAEIDAIIRSLTAGVVSGGGVVAGGVATPRLRYPRQVTKGL
jgi:hypothetical protein